MSGQSRHPNSEGHHLVLALREILRCIPRLIGQIEQSEFDDEAWARFWATHKIRKSEDKDT